MGLPLVQRMFIGVLRWIYTSLAVINLAYNRLRKGPAYLETKKREKPACLEGWNSNYLKLSKVRLHYVQTGADDKPLLLMIHGFPEFWYSWRFQLNEFKDKYRCVAIDQRGYNLSDKPVGVEFYRIDQLVDDVRETIEVLGYKQAVVMGHDWGAAIAWRMAMDYPEMVSKLIILNVPHPAAFMKLITTNFKQFCNSWYMFLFQTRVVPEMLMSADDYASFDVMFRTRPGGIRNSQNFTDEDLEAWKYTFGQRTDSFSFPLHYYRNIFSTELPKKAEKVKPKTLIVWGTGDTALVAEGADLSVKYCEDAVLKLVEGASHWVQQDEPIIVNRHIRQFLDN